MVFFSASTRLLRIIGVKLIKKTLKSNIDSNNRPPNVLTREIVIYVKPNIKFLVNKFNLILSRIIF